VFALPIVPLQLSTNPGNGDQNPYGLVFVPPGFPDDTVQPGDALVANFNNGANLQGTGTTIINIRPDRTSALFAGGLTPGLTAALGILRAGFVLVGSISTTDGTFATVKPGPITVLNSNGKLVTKITSSLLDGPWGMAIDDDGNAAEVYVSNNLNGTVVRINLTLTPSFTVSSITVIASGYSHFNNATFLLVGPSGLAFNEETHTLYVSDQIIGGGGAIYAVAKADTLTASGGTGKVVYYDNKHLHGPLGLAIAPNGDLLSAQADSNNVKVNEPSEIVEFAPIGPFGQFVAQYSIDHANGGAFNLALDQNSDALAPIKFAYVNDNAGTLTQLYLPTWGAW
jgi:hypothetical protein